MADKKISALTAATTPLAGTEVLPIVQSGATVKVSIADVTAGRAVSATSITTGLGAAGTPAYTFTGDTNTGMWSPAADTIAFSEGGTEAMRINSSGNVGIGTNSPAERLTVNSASSEFAIQWSGPGNEWVLGSAANRGYIRNKTASVETLTILNTGNVGIGTTTPTTSLQVAGGFITNNRFANPPVMQFDRAEGTASSPTAITSTSLIGAVQARGYDGSAYRTGANIFIYSDGAVSSISSPAYISFETTTSGSVTPSEKMRITSTGNVGIGEIAPDYRLDVNGTFGFTPGASVTPVDNGDVVFELTNNTTLTVKAKGSDGVVRSGTIILV